MWILRLHRAHFAPETVKWDETEGTNGCPHLYGNFGAADVDSTRRVEKKDGQSWAEAVKAHGDWLV